MKKVLKWIGIVLAGLVGLLILIVAALAIFGSLNFKRTQADRPTYEIAADTSPEGVARGEYLMEAAMACADACHVAADGTLSGNIEEINMGPIAVVFAVPNLTPDAETGLGDWTDAQIARAIREGVDKDGVELVVMPSYNYNALSDADVAAIIGYLRNLEPVRNEIPPFQANWIAKIMMAFGAFGPSAVQKPITEAQAAPPAGTVEYGRYLIALGACTDCHQANLAGGPLPFSEPNAVRAANLTPAGELPDWTVDEFVAAVTAGQHPSGRTLDEGMPRYGTTPEDLAAISAYLQTLPPTPANE